MGSKLLPKRQPGLRKGPAISPGRAQRLSPNFAGRGQRSNTCPSGCKSKAALPYVDLMDYIGVPDPPPAR
eukprot:5981088-Alexandrium_andersonii.AAC.1